MAGQESIYEVGERRLTVDHLLHLLHGVGDQPGAGNLYALILEENAMVRVALARAVGKQLPLCVIETAESRDELDAAVQAILADGRDKIGLVIADFDSVQGLKTEANNPVVVSQVRPLDDASDSQSREDGLIESGQIDGRVSLPTTNDSLAIELGVAINVTSRARGEEFDRGFEARCEAALYEGRDKERFDAGIDGLLADLAPTRKLDPVTASVVRDVLGHPGVDVKVEIAAENRLKEEVLRGYLDKYKSLTKLWKSFAERLSIYPDASAKVDQFSPEEDSRNVALGAERFVGIFDAMEVAEFVRIDGASRLRHLIHDINNILAWMPMSIDELKISTALTPDERAGMESVSDEMQELLAQTKAIRSANNRLETMKEKQIPGSHKDLEGMLTWDMVSKGEYSSPQQQKLEIAKGTRVLVVDDDKVLAEFCKRTIEQAGGICVIACSEADLAKAASEDFDWIWLDNNLGVGGGFQAVKMGYKLLGKLPKNARVAVHTGDVESLRSGENPYGDLPLVQKRDFGRMNVLMKA